MLQVVSVLMGIMTGVYWEYVANKPFKKFPTVVNSVIVNIGGIKFHVHHWLGYVVIVLMIMGWAIYRGKMMHPAVLFVVSVFLSSLVYYFRIYDDVFQFVVKK